MKGLLLKDYYLIGSVLWILLAAMAVIGIAMAVLTSAWALVVIATVMLGMVSVSTINMDKASGWYKVSRVMPVALPAVGTVDRVIDLVPQVMDRVENFIDKKKAAKETF